MLSLKYIHLIKKWYCSTLQRDAFNKIALHLFTWDSFTFSRISLFSRSISAFPVSRVLLAEHCERPHPLPKETNVQSKRAPRRFVLSNRAPTVDILTGSIEYLLHVEDKIRCGKEIFAIDDADWNCRSGDVDYEFVRVYSVHRAEYREYSCPVRECNWWFGAWWPISCSPKGQ